MKKVIGFVLVFFTAISFGLMAFAQEATVVTEVDYLKQISDFIHSYGGLSTFAKIAAAITLLLSSMKVSFFNELIWNKLGKFKAWAAPILAIAGGVLSQLEGGSPITVASLLVFFGTGVGSIAIHELLDTVKAIPGIGSTWISIIDLIKSVLGGPKTQAKNLYR